MNASNYIPLIIFVALCVPNRTRYTSLVLLSAYIIYTVILPYTNGFTRYAFIATLDLIAGVIILRNAKSLRLKAVGIFSLSFVLINAIGWLMYENYYPPTIYNNLCLYGIMLQTITLIMASINIDGIRIHFIRALNRSVIFRPFASYCDKRYN